jgi:hypothetical protein
MAEKFNQYPRILNPNTLSINTTKLPVSNQINFEKPETDKAFLERTGVKSILNTLLDCLYKNQPDDPINYICN